MTLILIIVVVMLLFGGGGYWGRGRGYWQKGHRSSHLTRLCQLAHRCACTRNIFRYHLAMSTARIGITDWRASGGRTR
jgi:hypothetical protein